MAKIESTVLSLSNVFTVTVDGQEIRGVDELHVAKAAKGFEVAVVAGGRRLELAQSAGGTGTGNASSAHAAMTEVPPPARLSQIKTAFKVDVANVEHVANAERLATALAALTDEVFKRVIATLAAMTPADGNKFPTVKVQQPPAPLTKANAAEGHGITAAFGCENPA